MNKDSFDLWLEFDHWLPQEGDDPEDDFFNMMITLAGGKKYALNVWTIKFLARAVQGCRDNGKCLDGNYVFPPDLFVSRLDRALMERVVADMIAEGSLKEEWLVRDYPDDP